MLNLLPRIAALRNLQILDTEEEDVFNEILEVALEICKAPVGIINLLDVDRQWFKAYKGISVRELPLEIAICTHTIQKPGNYMIVEDFRKDDRFKNNPFVVGEPHCISYAGVCLSTEEGHNIGTLAVFDFKPRKFSQKEIFCLKILAKGTMHLMNDKLVKLDLQNQNNTLKHLIKNMETFNYLVAHDVRAPLINMKAFSDLLQKSKTWDNMSSREKEFVGYIHKNSEKLASLIDDLLELTKGVHLESDQYKYIDSTKIISDLIQQLNPLESKIRIDFPQDLPLINTIQVVFERVFYNLISNSLKYFDPNKAHSNINICYEWKAPFHTFVISDNGVGMSEKRLESVFSLFSRNEENGESHGIGLTIVKELLERIGGYIAIESQLGEGTQVRVQFPEGKGT